MKFVRYDVRGKVKYGIWDDEVVHGIRGTPFYHFRKQSDEITFDGTTDEASTIRLLSPCLPSKVVCLGLNYRSHAEEAKMPIPSLPLIFLKPSTAVIGPDEEIVLPRDSKRVDYEAELGVVISRKAKAVLQDRAKDYILGYTCVNDVSERYAQAEDGQWTRAKGYDTFAPLGPNITTGIDPDDLKIETYLNGEMRQSARTSDLIFGIAELVSFISNVMTLLPGDVIATGTPSGIGRMNPGDIVEVRIEGIGTLRNHVVAAP
ncbi:MAG: fumarylacetoacetate hydrolase family protein [Dehalococcoidia bacterium]|nr:MAG: fumarylacetoacetate hydrolase family protein [Dehalococcoidia bacterium]